MRKYFYFIILFCSIIETSGQKIDFTDIKFIQGDRTYIITKVIDSFILERAPFHLRYFLQKYLDEKDLFYSAQVAVLENPNDLKLLRVGQKANNISYFKTGSGMAPDRSGLYETVAITNTGHHYLFYQGKEGVIDRSSLISTYSDILELEWKILGAFYNDRDVLFTQLKHNYLFFVIFIDNNLNDILDENEFKIIKIKFE